MLQSERKMTHLKECFSPLRVRVTLLIMVTAGIFSHVKTLTTCNFQSSTTFIEEPSDTTVNEGEDATFTCRVSNFNPNTDAITWVVSSRLSNNLISENSNPGTKEFTSRITILKVVGRMEENVKCLLRVLDADHYPRGCDSETASLSVYYFPSEEEMTCTPSDPPVVNKGENISVSCGVPRGNPPVELSWVVEGVNLTMTGSRSEGTLKILEEQLSMTHLLHSKVMECVAKGESVFSGQAISCTIGPFSVLLPNTSSPNSLTPNLLEMTSKSMTRSQSSPRFQTIGSLSILKYGEIMTNTSSVEMSTQTISIDEKIISVTMGEPMGDGELESPVDSTENFKTNHQKEQRYMIITVAVVTIGIIMALSIFVVAVTFCRYIKNQTASGEISGNVQQRHKEDISQTEVRASQNYLYPFVIEEKTLEPYYEEPPLPVSLQKSSHNFQQCDYLQDNKAFREFAPSASTDKYHHKNSLENSRESSYVSDDYEVPVCCKEQTDRNEKETPYENYHVIEMRNLRGTTFPQPKFQASERENIFPPLPSLPTSPTMCSTRVTLNKLRSTDTGHLMY